MADYDPYKTRTLSTPASVSEKSRAEKARATRARTGLSSTVFIHNDITFRVFPNSHIECGEDINTWCEHLASALQDNADADDLWVRLASAVIENKEIHMDIPMIPTVNQWARIALILADNFKTPTFEVVLIGPNEDQNNFIGHIHPGEGRMVIRSMIFDWFPGMITVENLSCKSTSHKYSAQMQWEQDMRDSKRKLAQDWSMYSTGSCLTCAAGGNASFDDLVPESDKKESIF